MKSIGFTLIEFIIILVLVAVTLTMGVPSLQDVIKNNRLTTEVNEFISALYLARSEAIKRAVRVTLCKSVDGETCGVAGGFEQGWIVFSDTDNNAMYDTSNGSNEELIRIVGPMDNGMSLTGNTHVANYISYTPSGRSQLISNAFQAGTLTLCSENEGRQIIINRVGRLRTEETHCP